MKTCKPKEKRESIPFPKFVPEQPYLWFQFPFVFLLPFYLLPHSIPDPTQSEKPVIWSATKLSRIFILL